MRRRTWGSSVGVSRALRRASVACWTPRSHWANGGKGKGKVGELLEGYGKKYGEKHGKRCKNMGNYGKRCKTMENYETQLVDRL